MPEITKYVESVKMKSFIGISENCLEVSHACVNVTGNEKKHWAVIRNDSSLRGETSSVLFVVFYYKGIREIVRIKTVVTHR